MRTARTVLGTLIVIACLSAATEAQQSKRLENAPAPPPAPARVQSAPPAAVDGPVNINTADVKTLTTLTGIGDKVAEKIVAYRQANGPFKTPEEIRKVSGVGPGLWEKNRARIVVK